MALKISFDYPFKLLTKALWCGQGYTMTTAKVKFNKENVRRRKTVTKFLLGEGKVRYLNAQSSAVQVC